MWYVWPQRDKNDNGDFKTTRLRALREEDSSPREISKKRTGLLRCYISRVENGHTVPAIETLEKWARAMDIPMYQIFHNGDEPPKLPIPPEAEVL